MSLPFWLSYKRYCKETVSFWDPRGSSHPPHCCLLCWAPEETPRTVSVAVLITKISTGFGRVWRWAYVVFQLQGKRRDVYWDFISLKMNRMSILQEVSTVRSHNSKTGALTRQVMSFIVSFLHCEFHFKSSCLWENTPAFTLWFYSTE